MGCGSQGCVEKLGEMETICTKRFLWAAILCLACLQVVMGSNQLNKEETISLPKEQLLLSSFDSSIIHPQTRDNYDDRLATFVLLNLTTSENGRKRSVKRRNNIFN